MLSEIQRIHRKLLPCGVATRLVKTGAHVSAIAHAKQERARRAVLIFMQFARWMHDERTRDDRDRLFRGSHDSATGKAEVDLGRGGMAVIGADLPRLPTGNRDIATLDPAENLLDVAA